LWAGSTYREFATWRERYPGGLSGLEEAFANAMTTLATRRRRRRRIAAALALGLTLVIAGVFGTLWRRSVQETRRAEAAKLLALGQAQLDTDPTEALAYATASLELADSEEARIFTVKALWAGPPLRALDLEGHPGRQFAVPSFSPDGRWLAVAGLADENVLVYGEDGREPVVLGGHAVVTDAIQCAWTGEGLLVTASWSSDRARIWAMPEGRLVREIDLGGSAFWQVGDTDLFAGVGERDSASGRAPSWPPEVFRLRSWRLPGGEPEELGTVDATGLSSSAFDPGGRAWIYSRGDSVFSHPLPVRAGVPDRVIARHSSDTAQVSHWPRPLGLYSNDQRGEVVLWTTAEGTSVEGRRLGTPETAATRLLPDPSGRWVVDADPDRYRKASLWDLQGLARVRPIELRRSGRWYYSHSDFHPGGRWVVATTNSGLEVSFWSLDAPSPEVVDGYRTNWRQPVAFTPDGRHLVTHWGQDRVRLWPLPGAGKRDVVDVKLPHAYPARTGVTVDPTGKSVLSTGRGQGIFLLSLTGEEPRRLEGFASLDWVEDGAFSPSGRLVAAWTRFSESPTLRVWDLSSAGSRAFETPREQGPEDYSYCIAFANETTLYTGGGFGLLRWDLETGTYDRILEASPGNTVVCSPASDRRKSLVYEMVSLKRRDSRVGVALLDLATGDLRSLTIPGEGGHLALSPDGTAWVTGEPDGSILIGKTDGGEAHLLAGHEGPVHGVAISPDNKWIASSGEDRTLRLWPMPDLDRPPLHTLPHDELIAKLESLTNLRAVRDDDSATGWTIEVGPFPGWETLPTW
jgi:WD40 repeat protein